MTSYSCEIFDSLPAYHLLFWDKKNLVPLSTHTYHNLKKKIIYAFPSKLPKFMFCFTIRMFSVFNLNPDYTVKKRDIFSNQTGMHNHNISLPKITLALLKAVSVSGCFEIWGSGHLNYSLYHLCLCFILHKCGPAKKLH